MLIIPYFIYTCNHPGVKSSTQKQEFVMENLIFSLNVTLPIFLTIVIGYVLKQIHMLNDSFVTVANKFNFKVTLPALLFLDLYQADFFSVWDTGYVLYCFFATLICFTVIMTGASLS